MGTQGAGTGGFSASNSVPLGVVKRVWNHFSVVEQIVFGLLIVIWLFLWRLPVLGGDDRTFASFFAHPRGQSSVRENFRFLRQLYFSINGRIADVFNTLGFAIGEGIFRALVALVYVVMLYLLWRWVAIAGGMADRNAQRNNWGAIIFLGASVSLPFLLTWVNPIMGGETVFYLASAVNYFLGFTILLLSLYPLYRSAHGLAVRPVLLYLSIPGIILACAWHEIISVMVLGIVLVCLWKLKKRCFKWPYLAVFGASILGQVIKFTAPGLWTRKVDYASENLRQMGFVRRHFLYAGRSLGELGSLDWRVVLLLVGACIATVAVGFLVKTRYQYQLVFYGFGAAILLGAFIVVSMLQYLQSAPLVLRGAQPHEVYTSINSALVVASFILFALAALFLLAISIVLDRIHGPGTLIVWAGLMASLVIPVFIGGTSRSLFMAVFMMALFPIVILMQLWCVAKDEERKLSGIFTTIPAAMLIAFGLTSGISLVPMLYENYLAWEQVVAEIEQAKHDHSSIVEIPKEMPHPQMVHYYLSANTEIATKQIRLYYDIDKNVQIKWVDKKQFYLPFTQLLRLS